MPAGYNPIIRTFGQLRTALGGSLNLARHAIRPGAPLDALIPVRRRRKVWRRLRRHGLRVPTLELSPRDRAGNVLVVLKTALALAFWATKWVALPAVVPLGLLAYGVSRPRAVHFPFGLKTVGDLVLYLTTYSEHKCSGYRWTYNEVAYKVRLVLAESLALPLDTVRPESTLEELGAL